jgi:predicted secreted protein
MAGFAGRKATLTVGGVGSIAIMSKGLSVNNEMIDTTNDNSGGWKTGLFEPGMKSCELSFSGVVENLSLLMSIFDNTSQTYACVITYPEGSTVTGNFDFGSYSDTGETSDKYTFEASMASNGAIVFAAGV